MNKTYNKGIIPDERSLMSEFGDIFDISAYNLTEGQPTQYANLAAALGTNGANVPVGVRAGGMSVRFINSTGKYEQWRYMGTDVTTTATFTNVSNWQGVDETPTAGSNNLVMSGGVKNELVLGSVYDVSGHNGGITFASLSALLSDANINTLIPLEVRSGGMSIKFVQSSDNKYVQYFLTKDEWSASEADWEKMNLEEEINQLNLDVSGIDISSNNNVHVPFQIKSGKSYRFTNKSASALALYLRNQQSSTGQAYVGSIASGSYIDYTAESDFTYLYFYNTSSAQYTLNVQDADSLGIGLTNSDGERVAYASINSLDMGGNSGMPFVGRVGSVNWSVSANNGHRLVIVKPGDVVKVKAASTPTIFAFLKTYTLPVHGQPVPYCSGTTYISVLGGQTGEATAPSDARFVYIETIYEGINTMPSSIKINNVEVPYIQKNIKGYLDDLNSLLSEQDSEISSIWDFLIIGANITLAGSSSSKLTLNEPIVLSQNGDEIEIITSGIGNENPLSFASSGLAANGYYAIQLGKAYVGIRAADGTWLHQSTSITSSTKHTIKILYSSGNILTYVDGSLVNTYTGQKTVQVASFGNGGAGTYGYWAGTIDAIKLNGQDLNLYLQKSESATVTPHYRFASNDTPVEYPKGILKYDATNKKFDFYSRLGDSNKYFMFRVRLDQNDSDEVYLKEWRWSYGLYCEYDGSAFTDIAITAIDAENEMAMYFKNAIDYTGGIHGDERIDISQESFVKFFVDGKLISDAEMETDFTIECASFAYMQLSSLHETSTIENEFVEDHPIIAMHYKRNTFENCQSHLENRIIFTSETAQYVTQYHAGLMCVGKGTATYALLPNAVATPQLTGTNDVFDADNTKCSRVDMWNPTNGLRCYVEGRMVEGIEESDINVLQVWDRVNDTKYYRRMVVSSSNAKVFQEGDAIINEQRVVYY